jgi:hypothetical protein
VKEADKLEEEFKAVFARWREDHKDQPNVQFCPIIFDAGKCPLENAEARFLPQQLKTVHDLFVKTYEDKHSTAKLVLLNGSSSVESKFHVPKHGNMPAKTYTIACDILCYSIIQAVASHEAPMRLREIINVIGEQPLLRQSLIRLCGQASPILKRTAETKQLGDNDCFQLNAQYASSASRVVVPPVVSERKQNAEAVARPIQEEHLHSVRAAIVRVLKQGGKVSAEDVETNTRDWLRQSFHVEAGVYRQALRELEAEGYYKLEEIGGKTMLAYIQ